MFKYSLFLPVGDHQTHWPHQTEWVTPLSFGWFTHFEINTEKTSFKWKYGRGSDQNISAYSSANNLKSAQSTERNRKATIKIKVVTMTCNSFPDLPHDLLGRVISPATDCWWAADDFSLIAGKTMVNQLLAHSCRGTNKEAWQILLLLHTDWRPKSSMKGSVRWSEELYSHLISCVMTFLAWTKVPKVKK